MNRRTGVWRGAVLLSLWLIQGGCSPDGDVLIPGEEKPDPCFDADTDVLNGIQSGSELADVFYCMNSTGELDPYMPVIMAMETSLISDGQRTVLDMWVDIFNEKLLQLSESDATLNTSDLQSVLDQVIAALEEAWLPDAVDLLGDLLESGAVEPIIPVMGSIAEELVQLQDPTVETDAFDVYVDQMVQMLCPDLEQHDQCVGDVQQLYRSTTDMLKLYGQEGYAFPSGELIAELLAGLFATQGSYYADNLETNESLGRGIARLGEGTFLMETTGTMVPALYGDDPATSELEGYDSFNANESALYGIMTLMADPEYFEAMKLTLNSLGPLVDKYYKWNPIAPGKSQEVKNGICEAGDGETFLERNPAYHGFDQVIRILKSSDVDYTAYPECQAYLETAISAAGVYFELSGSTNLGTIVMEIFSQLPPEAVTLGVDALSISEDLVLEFNDFCGTEIILDDYEALQAFVHMPEVLDPMLLLLEVVTHADRPGTGGYGGMDTMKDMLVALYDTHLLCEAQPWLAAALQAGNPLPDFMDEIKPILPGQPYHDTITVPLMRVMANLRGTPTEVLIPPMARGLQPVGDEIGGILTGLGVMGNDAVKDALYGATPPLYRINEILADVATYDTGYQGVEAMARGMDEQLIMSGLLETLAAPEVQESFNYEIGSEPPIAATSDFVNSGQLLELLYLVRGLLEQVNPESL